MQFNRGIWAESIRVLSENLTVAIPIAVLGFLASICEQIPWVQWPASIFTILAWPALAYVCHATVLFGRTGWGAISEVKSYNSFWLRMLGLTILAVLALLPLLFFVPRRPVPITTAQRALFSGGLALVAFAIVVVWGTQFPAIVAKGDKSARAAFRRAKLVGGYLALRIILGAGIVYVGLSATSASLLHLGILRGFAFDGVLHFSGTDFFFRAISTLLFVLSAALLAVTLSRAYLLAEAKSGHVERPLPN